MRVRDGKLLMQQRQSRGFTQRDLAYLARCSQNMIWMLEAGKRVSCSDILAYRIARALGVAPDLLFVEQTTRTLPPVTAGSGRRAS